jgi:hypothetical protein
MDHCEAIRNAPQAGGTVGVEVRVVDCIVHIEAPQMRKKKAKKPRATKIRRKKSPYFLMLLKRMPRCYPRSTTGRSFSGVSMSF